jgi:hypothetical protein
MLSVAQRLPRFYRHQQQIEDLKRIGEILSRAGKSRRRQGSPFAGRPTVTTLRGFADCRRSGGM